MREKRHFLNNLLLRGALLAWYGGTIASSDPNIKFRRGASMGVHTSVGTVLVNRRGKVLGVHHVVFEAGVLAELILLTENHAIKSIKSAALGSLGRAAPVLVRAPFRELREKGV